MYRDALKRLAGLKSGIANFNNEFERKKEIDDVEFFVGCLNHNLYQNTNLHNADSLNYVNDVDIPDKWSYARFSTCAKNYGDTLQIFKDSDLQIKYWKKAMKLVMFR